MALLQPTEFTDGGVHTLADGDVAGTTHDPAYVVVIPPGDWDLLQVSARELLLLPGAHLTLGSADEASAATPSVSHLYHLTVSPDAELNAVGSTLQENATTIAPSGTLAIQPTSVNDAANQFVKLGTLVNGGNLELNTPVTFTSYIELPGGHVSDPANLLQMNGPGS